MAGCPDVFAIFSDGLSVYFTRLARRKNSSGAVVLRKTVIYDPWPTPLVIVARNRHLPTVGGHVMLAHQAYGQFEQFTGYPAPREAMWAALTSCGPLSQ